jgi:hypothetical protein
MKMLADPLVELRPTQALAHRLLQARKGKPDALAAQAA